MELLPKVLKKIGLGIISLGLISTFYIPEAKANLTLFEFEYPSSVPVLGGRTYALKKVTSISSYGSSQYLMRRVGSGNTFCKKYISSVSQLISFLSCVENKLSSDIMHGLLTEVITQELGL